MGPLEHRRAEAIDVGRELNVLDVQLIAQDVDVGSQQTGIGRGDDGGIEAFIRREVLPYTPDAWVKEGATKIGYEVSFTRHFYKPTRLRSLGEIRADIAQVEAESEDLISDIIGRAN